VVPRTSANGYTTFVDGGDLDDAIWGDPTVNISQDAVQEFKIKALEAMGHTVELLPEYTAGVGGMQGILVNQTTRTMTAGADPRRAGYAIGW
jgi:gamma-glutamyltranspeptidase